MAGKTSPGEQQLPDDLVSEMASLSSKAVSEDFLVLTEALKSRFGVIAGGDSALWILFARP